MSIVNNYWWLLFLVLIVAVIIFFVICFRKIRGITPKRKIVIPMRSPSPPVTEKKPESESNWIDLLKKATPSPQRRKRIKTSIISKKPQEVKLVDNGQRILPKYSKTELILQNEMNLIGLKAESQYPISRMHVDFAFPEKKLVVEVDGPYKRNRQGEEIKNRRRSVCESLGWKVLNYTAEEVYENPSLIAYKIKKALERE
jgi:very-short-patch-repair endonuclease